MMTITTSHGGLEFTDRGTDPITDTLIGIHTGTLLHCGMTDIMILTTHDLVSALDTEVLASDMEVDIAATTDGIIHGADTATVITTLLTETTDGIMLTMA